jgi:uncharacterized repeat protein (TIGR02543 family)
MAMAIERDATNDRRAQRRRGAIRGISALVTGALAATGLVALAVQPAIAAAPAATTFASGDAVTPIVSYNFDSDSGSSVTDGAGSGNGGTWSGTPAYSGGVSGQAAHVSGGTNFITLPRNAQTEITTGSTSVEFWYKQNTATSDGVLFGNENWNSGTNPGVVLFNTNGTSDERLGTNIGDGSGTRVKVSSLGTPLNSGWTYVTLVVNRSTNTMTTYEDGGAVNTSSIASTTHSLDGDAHPFRIGQDGTGTYGNSVDGLVDDLNLYNAAITPAQIQADYAATNPNPTHASDDTTLPIVSYDFDGDAGTTVSDSSGSGNNGTWSGAPTYVAGIAGQASHVDSGNANDHISLPRVAGKTDGSNSFASEFWWYDVKETADSPFFGNQNFASCTNPGVAFYHISGTYGQRSCYGIGSTRITTTNITTGHQNAWAYYTVSYDAAAHTYTYYVNGVQQSQTSTISGSTAANFNSGMPFNIGQDGTGTYGSDSDGYVDDFNFYNSPVSSAQVQADYAATNPATPNTVTVSNDGHGTGTASESKAAAGDTVTLTAHPAAGYHFDHWQAVTPADLAISANGTFTAPGANVTVEAVFAPNQYTVAFDGNGADGGSTASFKLSSDQSLNLPANGFTRTDDTFLGWSTSPTGPVVYTDGASVKNLTTDAGATVTLYAQWRPSNSHQVTVTGDLHVSATASEVWASPGDVVTLTTKAAEGYHLGPWQSTPSVDVGADGSFTMPKSDVAITAASVANSYTITFHGNGSDGGSVKDESLSYDKAQALSDNAFTRAGYLFAGWSATANGPAIYTDGASVTNLVSTDGATVALYAQWWKRLGIADTAAPVLSYDFDSDSGTSVADGTPFKNNGAWKGNAAYTTGVGGTGKAAIVTGSAGTVQLPLVKGQTDGSGNFSVEFWYGDQSFTGDAFIFSNNTGGACSSAFNLYHNTAPNGALRGCFGQTDGGTKEYQAVTATPVQNTWHHVAGVVDRGANTVTWYVDGVQTAQSAVGDMTSATNFVTGVPFTLGQNGALNYTSDDTALFDDLSFYDSSITAAQIQGDYAATKPASAALPATLPPTDTSKLTEGFLTSDLTGATVHVGGTVSQPVSGLWVGGDDGSFTKVSGDSWLSVDANGVVTGTAPAAAPQHPATITVQATDGKVTSQITIAIPVIAAHDAPELWTATWNLWNAGTFVDDSFGKDIQAIAQNGLTVIGVQEDGGTVAKTLATDLGWYSYEGADGLGIVSAYPISSDDVVAATGAAPAVGVSVDVAGKSIRVWDAALDEDSADTRDSQAKAVVAKVKPELTGSAPVVLLGDLASSGEAKTFTDAGLTDTYAVANPDAPADQGNTLLYAAPSDRVDFVLSAGDELKLVGSSTVVTGLPSAADPANSSWTSDHAAVASVFTLGTPLPQASAPTVSVTNSQVVYEAGSGPAADAALLKDIDPTADPSSATISVDSSDVDYTTPGTYTVLVTATDPSDGYVSDPVEVVVQVLAGPTLTLSNGSASFPAADSLAQGDVLDALGASMDVPGSISVDLSTVRTRVPGSYQVTVKGTDDNGFTAALTATVVIADSSDAQFDVTVQAAAHGGTGSADPTPASAGSTVTLTAIPDAGYQLTGWQALTPSDLTINADGTFTMPDGPVAVQPVYAPITYQIAYELAGGTTTGDNPTSYTVESDAITLSNPTRQGYTFAGWTGTGHATPSMSVTIPTGSTGDLSFTANWTATPPVLKFESPAAGAVLKGQVTVTVSLSGTDLQAYNLRADAAGLSYAWEPTAGDQSYTLDTTTLTNGVHTLLATATTAEGGKATITEKMTVDNPPTVTLTTPQDGAKVQGTIPVVAQVIGQDLAEYIVTVDGRPMDDQKPVTAGTQTFQLDTTILSNGAHTLTINAIDALGGTTLVSAKLTVANPAAWSAKTAYNAGDQVTYQGAVYQAAWYAKGAIPGADPNSAWKQVGELTVTAQGNAAAWTASWIYNGGETVAYNGNLYTAAWYTRDSKPGDANGAWEQIGAPVTTDQGTFPAWTASWIYNGNEKVAYKGHLYMAQWYTRNQAPGTVGGPWLDLGAYGKSQ